MKALSICNYLIWKWVYHKHVLLAFFIFARSLIDVITYFFRLVLILSSLIKVLDFFVTWLKMLVQWSKKLCLYIILHLLSGSNRALSSIYSLMALDGFFIQCHSKVTLKSPLLPGFKKIKIYQLWKAVPNFRGAEISLILANFRLLEWKIGKNDEIFQTSSKLGTAFHSWWILNFSKPDNKGDFRATFEWQ